MAKQISAREVGGIPLLTVEMSEGEVEVLLGALDYLLADVAPNHIESITGAYPDEVMAIRDDIRSWLDQQSSQLLTKVPIKEPI